MAFKKKLSLDTDKTIKLGGMNSETGKPNPTSIEGYYLGSRTTPDTGYGPGTLHFFQTEEGVVGVWGKTRLNTLLTSDLAGQMVRATFTGMGKKQKGKSPAFLFSVEHDDENTIDVSGIIAATAEEPSADDVGDDSDDSDQFEDTDLDADEEAVDVAPAAPARPAPRNQPVAAPNADQKAKVAALLAGRKTG